MIKSVHIENFKKFSSVTVPLKNFTVLMGENSSGKTTILQAIALASRLYTTSDLVTYDSLSGVVSRRNKGLALAQLPGLFVEDPNELYHAKNSRGGNKGGTTPFKIEVRDDNDNEYKLVVSTLFSAFNVKSNSTKEDLLGVPLLVTKKSLYISGFIGVLAGEERLFPAAIQDRLLRGKTSEIIRNILLDVFEKNRVGYGKLVAKLRDHFDFNISSVKFDGTKELYVHTSYQQDIGGRTIELDLSASGSGLLQILQILAPIYRYSGEVGLVLLDEPDSHLHPNLQREVSKVLAEISAEESVQVIISTHSTTIIREASPEAVLPVISDKPTLFYLNKVEDVESEIQIRIDNFTMARISLFRKIIFVEDKNRQVIERFDQVVGTNKFGGFAELPILSSQGKDDKIPFRIKTVLEKITGESVSVFFIRDSDGIPKEHLDLLLEHAKKNSVDLRFLSRHEIENYLLEEQLLFRACGSDVAFGEDYVRSVMERCMRDSISMNRFGFDKTLRDNLYKMNRIVNSDFSFGDSEKEASKIRSEYEMLSDIAQLKQVSPGKEVLSAFFGIMKAEKGISLSLSKVLDCLRIEDIDADIVKLLKEM